MYDMHNSLARVSKELLIEDPDPWDIVDLFEKKISKYCGAKYGIALDSCTNALFLCLKYKKIENQSIRIPKHTYLSVPQLILHSGNYPEFFETQWSGSYPLGNTQIYDSAGRIKKNMYLENSFMCVSFHRKKCIPIGKGGMVLTDNPHAYEWMQKAVYEGRDRRQLHDEINDIDILGWNMYMTPEAAGYGLELFDTYESLPDIDTTSSEKYNDISSYSIFN